MEIRDFDVDRGAIFTIEDALRYKYKDCKRTLSESLSWFDDFKDETIESLTFDRLLELNDHFMKRDIKVGGQRQKGHSGLKKKPSLMTVFRRFAYLSSSVNYLISQGNQIVNNCPKVIAWLKVKMKEDKDK